MAESVHTHLMFQNGRALEALLRYEEIFDSAFNIDELDTYDKTAAGLTGQVQLAVCTLLGQRITCIDSPVQHDFDMTPAISLFVECDNETELERRPIRYCSRRTPVPRPMPPARGELLRG